jgi:hypothetical protein
MAEVDKHGRPSVNILLVGNKSDLASSRVVKTEKAEVRLIKCAFIDEKN